MKEIHIDKAQPIDEATGAGAVESVTIIIDKVFACVPSENVTGGEFMKQLDGQFNDQAAKLAEALQASLPGGTWDRLVGIMVRRHASYLVVSRDKIDEASGI